MAVRKIIKEDESDYINVGNIMLPRDAREYGYDSYDAITKKTQRRYDDEKEAERQAREREEAERQRQAFIKEHEEEIEKAYDVLVDTSLTSEKKIERLFDLFVPRSGACETLGGEIVRAVSRIVYRWFNDGDVFYTGYGIETCARDAGYLVDNTDEKIADLICDYADNHNNFNSYENYEIKNSEYDTFLNKLEDEVCRYLFDHEEVFALKRKTDSRTDDNEWARIWDEDSHGIDYEPDINYIGGDYWEILYENDLISMGDVSEYMENMTMSGLAGEVVESRYSDAPPYVSKLNIEEYDEWCRQFPRWFEEWLADQYEEHKDEIDEEERERYGLDD